MRFCPVASLKALTPSFRTLQNGFAIQYGLIIQSFGFTTVQTTALNIPGGVAEIVGVTLSTIILRQYPVSRSLALIPLDLT